jgi:hypothetical protein
MYFGQYDKSLREEKRGRLFNGVLDESDFADIFYFKGLEGPFYYYTNEHLIISSLFLIFLSMYSQYFFCISYFKYFAMIYM